MTQLVKAVDLSKTYAPVNPNAFPQNLFFAASDAPYQPIPILAFEGYNFLPTHYGYKSYFGTSASLDIDLLPSRCDKILLYQFANYKNILVALCEDGLYVCRGNVSSLAWTKSKSLSVPSVGDYKAWTYCTIANTLYLYRQGHNRVFSISPTGITGDVVTVAESDCTATDEAGVTTSILTADMMGLFRANGRLGFWNASNGVFWSSFYTLTDFTPSAETLAGFGTFRGVLGRITTILPQGEGFAIYCTKSIIGVRYSQSAEGSLWDATTVSDSGVAFPFQVCHGLTELEHYAWTSTGIKQIGGYNAINRGHDYVEVFTELYDWLKETREPVRLDFLNGRFLCFSIVNPDYIDASVNIGLGTSGAYSVRILANGAAYTNQFPIPATVANTPIGEHIADQITSGQRSGEYLQWVASGSLLYPGRKSAINVYGTDTVDTAADISPAEAQSLLTGYTYTQPTPEVFPLAEELGWRFPGLGVIGTGRGQIESTLQAFKAAQILEWQNLATVAAANLANVNAVVPIVEAWIQEGAGGLTAAAADAAITTGIASSVAGKTDVTTTSTTATYTQEDVAEFAKGSSLVTSEEVTELGYTLSGTMNDWYRTSLTYFKEYRKTAEASTVPLKRGSFTLSEMLVSNTYLWNLPGVADYSSYTIEGYTPTPLGGSVTSDTGLARLVPRNVSGVTPVLRIYGNSGAELAADWARIKTEYVLADAPDWVQRVEFYSGGRPVGYKAMLQGITETVLTDDSGSYPTINIAYYATYTTNQRLYLDDMSVYGTQARTVYLYPFEGDSQAGNNLGYTSASTTVQVPSYKVEARITKSLVTRSMTAAAYTSVEMTADEDKLTWGLANPRDPTLPVSGISFPSTAGAIPINSFTEAVPAVSLTYPPTTFLLQDGSIGPIYPTYTGLYCFDTALKKWGKGKLSYTSLLDYQPVNQAEGSISYTNFGMDAGMLNSSGLISLFTQTPSDSYIRYGKIGYDRKGYSHCAEVRIHFANPSTGSILLDSSADGRTLDLGLSSTQSISSALSSTLLLNQSGRWHTITISGQFDLSGMEFRGSTRGRR
jgi:hypothetical protein